jgi:serpin B
MINTLKLNTITTITVKNPFSSIGLVVVLIILTTFGCQKITEGLPEVTDLDDLSASQIALVESENSFAFDIFRLILENTDESENIIISPLSISYALCMALNGADGATRDSMLNTLKIDGITPEEINKPYKDLTRTLFSVDTSVKISVANSVWTENTFIVKRSFIDILTSYYDSESKQFDISDISAACNSVNKWIVSETSGLIKNMLVPDDLDELTKLLLINAICFKGKWQKQFNPDNTSEDHFCKPSGAEIVVPMMKYADTINYYKGDGFSLAEFPYGQGNFVMDIILPDTKTGTFELLPSVNEGAFNDWVSQLEKRTINVSLPRYKYGSHKHLKDNLTNMGMGIAFSGEANFTKISDYRLHIYDVIHQAYIESNEEGTEAAAATIVIFGGQCCGVTPPFFYADHSFLYIIREIKTNAIIFMGRVADPLKE